MIRVCHVHKLELVQTQDLFPGSPCTAEQWCPSRPGGHAVRYWQVIDERGDVVAHGRQGAPKRTTTQTKVVTKPRKIVKPRADHPWLSRGRGHNGGAPSQVHAHAGGNRLPPLPGGRQ